MWAALSVAQRAKAMQRMTALSRWTGDDGKLDAKKAAGDAGVSVTRLYEMAKEWRTKRSLDSLGTFAGAPKTRLGVHDAAIRRALVAVFDANPQGSVRKLAFDLEAAIGEHIEDPPSHNTLRRYVEEERRRREREDLAGNDLMLDCSACVLKPSDDVLMTAFVIVDRATQVIVGAGLGDVADSRAGYSRAARDGRRRLFRGELGRLRWAERMARAEIVVGTDLSVWTGARERFAAAGVGCGVEMSTRSNRYGRYLRPATGLRIGTVVLMPTHTVSSPDGSVLKRVTSPTDDHVARFSVEVDEYNATAMSGFSHGSNLPPPPDLPRLLELLSSD
ncbi:hypothetical protein [Polymorphobacter megasporae]|uniref:hypothetical protein n=1 Tax=Glacieibacterium megasporae TaxID=2835787 RepID=UPI001C1E4281|nr:hypothetical protein [Polymorphobacter megasporae]UAJ11075.1 hypothetical protein KTC28_05020 [Polymorphobacter megasporae]